MKSRCMWNRKSIISWVNRGKCCANTYTSRNRSTLVDSGRGGGGRRAVTRTHQRWELRVTLFRRGFLLDSLRRLVLEKILLSLIFVILGVTPGRAGVNEELKCITKVCQKKKVSC